MHEVGARSVCTYRGIRVSEHLTLEPFDAHAELHHCHGQIDGINIGARQFEAGLSWCFTM